MPNKKLSKKTKKQLRVLAFPVLTASLLFLAFAVFAAWSNPTASPPGNNTEAPINVGSTGQTKTGNLTVNNLYLTATSEGNFYNINQIIGFNDLLLYGNSTKSAPIYLEATSVIINNDAGTGNVGIGTTNPGYKLDVSTDVNIGTRLNIAKNSVLYLPSNNPETGPWNPIWNAIGSSKPIYFDEEFASGNNSVSVYNNSGGSSVTITRQTGQVGVPNSTGVWLKVSYDGIGPTSPNFGGVVQIITSVANKTFVQRFRAKVPVGKTLNINENSQGTNSTSYWLTNNVGTGKWEDYIRVSHTGNTGTFSSGGHISISGGSGAFDWYIASMNVYEVNVPLFSSPNTWLSAQIFSGGANFPGSGIWNTSGNVGINQTAPGAKLTVNNPTTAGKVGATGDAIYAYANNTNAAISAEQGGTGYAGYFSGNVAVTGTLTASSKNVCLADGTNCPGGSSLWTLSGTNIYNTNTTGNVGIGTTGPGAKLEVSASGNHLLLDRESTETTGGNIVFLELRQLDPSSIIPLVYPSIRFHHNNKFWNRIEGRNDGIHFKTGDIASDAYIKTFAGDGYFAGNVGIGTTSPDANYRLTLVAGGIKAETDILNQPAGYFSSTGGGAAIQAGTGAIVAGANGITLGGVNKTTWPAGGVSDAFANIANSAGTVQFSASGADTMRLAAGSGLSIVFDAVSKMVTYANTGDLSSTNEIQNIIASKGLQRDASNNFGIINCATDQIMKYNASSQWVCAADAAGITSEADTLQTVTNRGNTTTLGIGVGIATIDANYRITTSGGGIKAETNILNQPAGYFSSTGGGAAIQAGTGAIVAGANGITLGGVNKTTWPAGTIAGSGTANYISKFTDGTTLGNSQIFDNGTNVGIGTTGPGTKLEVNGQIKTGGNYYNVISYNLNGTPVNGVKIKTNIPYTNGSQMPTIIIEGYDYGAASPVGISLVWYIYSGNFINYKASSWGNVAPVIKLANEGGLVTIHLAWAPYFGRFTVRTYAQGMSEVSSWFNGWTVVDEAAGITNQVTVPYSNIFPGTVNFTGGIWNSSGNVGIGTTAPIGRLDVLAGAARTGTHGTTPSFYVTGTMGTGQTGPASGNVEFRHDNGTQGIGFGYNTIYQTGSNTNQDLNLLSRGTSPITLNAYAYSTGNVGIGTTSPSQKLDVNGNIVAQSSVGATQYCINPSGGCITSWAQIAGTGGWTDDGTTVRLTNASDNVGIGTTTPGAKLDVNGNIRTLGSDIFAQSDNINTAYNYAPIQIREAQYGATIGYLPPRLSFHWGGVVASQLTIESDGTIAVRDNPGTGYEKFKAGAATLYGNLNFNVANPYISASSYFIAPGGAYFNSGTVYTEAAIQVRGGINNDSGSNGGDVNINESLRISGAVTCLQGYCPSNSAMRMTPNFHLNALGGYAVILNWDNGTTGTAQTFRIGNGAGSDVFWVRANGETYAAGNVGIGTVSPGAKLDVAGTVKMTGFQLGASTTAGYVLTANASGVGTWQATPGGGSLWTDAGTYIYANNATNIVVTDTGNVGIGMTSPGNKLVLISSRSDSPTDIAAFASTLNISGAPVTVRTDDLRVYDDATSGNITNLQGRYAEINVRNAGTVSTVKNLSTWGTLSGAGNVTDWIHYEISNISDTGVGSITNQYGLKIGDLTAATNNWSIYTGSAKSYFGGNVGVAGNLQVDGAITAPEGTLRDDGGGWVRTYGATGWYSQTYGGGWYMTDTTWIRAYNNKYVRAAYFYSDSLGAYATVGSGTAGYLTRWTGTYTQGNSVIYDNGTNVGIGTAGPTIKLAIGDTDTGLNWAGDGQLDLYSNNVNTLSVRSGNVGIGTAPGLKLDVSGDIRASQFVWGGWGATFGSLTDSDMNTTLEAHGSGWNGVGMYGDNTGTIFYRLTQNNQTGWLNMYNNDSNALGLESPAHIIFKTNNGTEAMRIVGGNVGIGTTSPAYKLDVRGGTVAGAGAYVNTSWSGYKTDFRDVDPQDVLKKINELKIRSWVFKPDHVADDPYRHISPFGEDFYRAFGLGKDEKVITSLDVAGVALVGIQELSQKINNVENENNVLKQEVEILKSEIKELEAKLNIGQ